ncbi:MAG: hypothetical protein B7733_17140 [Myxococcales bacterium FL481]|nr:MAG: hypothetical protein B7733_17140 [Myxococcales bacterium FL481]
MISVMLLTASMLTVAALVVRSSVRQLSQSSASVSRERALMVAQAGVDLAAARMRAQLREGSAALGDQLAGNVDNAQPNPAVCSDATLDCIPGQGEMPTTGQRNHALTLKSDCGGRPCMRPGAIARLPDADGDPVYWANVPIADLFEGADPEARITVWVRNNAADAIGGGSGTWTEDSDNRVVLTSMATIRNTQVTVEQEMMIAPSNTASVWSMESPDKGYGGGHNNDSTSASVCRENYMGAE